MCCLQNIDSPILSFKYSFASTTGSSDGVVRVFTKDPARYADEATLKQFEEDVTKMQAASQQEIGGFKLSE